MKLRRQAARLVAVLLTSTLAVTANDLDRAAAQVRQPDQSPSSQLQLRQTLPIRDSNVGTRGFTTTVRPATTTPQWRIAEPDSAQQAGPNQLDPGTDPATDPTLSDDDPPRMRTRHRNPVDGDLSWPPPPPQMADGVIPQVEAPLVDGTDPATTDQRNEKEADEVDGPPAGYDVNAFVNDTTAASDPFTIELDPSLDRRPAQFARFEPYRAVGYKAGGFTVFPEAEFAVTADNNLFRSSSNQRRDVSFDVRPTVRMVSNWRSHALEFRASGTTSFHNQFSTEDDRGYLLEARGRVDVNRRTNAELLASHERSQDLRGSINAASATGDRTDIDTNRLGLTLNHRLNRLAIQLRGTVTETDFSPVEIGTGAVLTNDERDSAIREGAARATWLFKPNFGVFGEVAINDREYRMAASDGIRRDSAGDRVRTGLAFGTTSQVLRGEVSIGHLRQRFEDSRLPAISGLIMDANLALRVSGLTSLLFTGRTDVSESIQVGSGGALSQMVSVEVRHTFHRYLIGTAAVQLAKQDYEGLNLSEKSLTSLLGIEYYINRNIMLFSRYQHIEFDSTTPSRNYNDDEVRVGVRVRQ